MLSSVSAQFCANISPGIAAKACRVLLAAPRRLGLMVACLAHDLEHPGVTGSFLAQADGALAAAFKDQVHARRVRIIGSKLCGFRPARAASNRCGDLQRA
jgi:hypothetical protein